MIFVFLNTIQDTHTYMRTHRREHTRTSYPYEHFQEIETVDFEIHKVTTSASLLIGISPTIEKIINRKYNIHIKSDI
jgi:hypothetical protein